MMRAHGTRSHSDESGFLSADRLRLGGSSHQRR